MTSPDILAAAVLNGLMSGAVYALIAVGLTLTVMAGPIFSYSGRAADQVLNRGQYISAVVGGTR